MKKGNLKLAAVTAVLLGLGAPALASGATRYAEPDGDGPEPCAKGNPCDIVTAVEGATTTDKVRLASGNYSVTVVVDIPDGTDVGGIPGKAKPVVAGTAFYVFGMNGSDSSLHDIEVRTDALHGVFVAGTLERARVRATTGGTACVAGFGLIRDSLCTNTDAGGIALGIQSGCVGPGVHTEANAVNVTAIATAGAGVAAQATGGCDIAVVGTNVIASGNPYDITAGADLAVGSRAEVALSYSAFDSSSAPGVNDFVTSPGTGQNITTGATFVDAAAGNYRQVESSSTRNEGTTSPDLGELDLDREPRIGQGAPDIGADEYFPAPGVKIIKPKTKVLETSKPKELVKFKFKARGATSFECKVDKDPWKKCESPEKIALKSGGGEGKKHIVKVRSVNALGDQGKAARWKGHVVRQ